MEGFSAELPEAYLSQDDRTSLLATIEQSAQEAAASAAPEAPSGASTQTLFDAIRRIESVNDQGSNPDGDSSRKPGILPIARVFSWSAAKKVRGWAGMGFGDVDQAFGQKERVKCCFCEYRRRVGGAQGLDAEQCAEIAGQLGAAAGSFGVLIPFILRGQVSGALFADRPGRNSRCDEPPAPGLYRLPSSGYGCGPTRDHRRAWHRLNFQNRQRQKPASARTASARTASARTASARTASARTTSARTASARTASARTTSRNRSRCRRRCLGVQGGGSAGENTDGSMR